MELTYQSTLCVAKTSVGGAAVGCSAVAASVTLLVGGGLWLVWLCWWWRWTCWSCENASDDDCCDGEVLSEMHVDGN